MAEIARIWRETVERRSAQLVFCDLSTPTRGKGFSVYEDMRDKLVELGVPPPEIEFMQDHDSDAAKLDLFRNVRAGKVRILFGSTQKMGSGTNVQERLVALHHLDAPWRPADVEQREGRILRQGNTNPEVQLHRYVTEQSFDAYLWQVLESKARFIAQVMTGESDLRRIEDVDGAALTYAEVKAIASGNPLVIEKAGIDSEVARLTRLRGQHHQTQSNLRIRLRHQTDDGPRLQKRLVSIQSDMVTRHDTSGDRFVIEIEGQEIRDRGMAGELILRRAEKLQRTGAERAIGKFAGFQLIVADLPVSGPQILLRGEATHSAKVSNTALGTIRSVEYAIQNLDEVVASVERTILETEKRIVDLTAQIGQPYEYEERLATQSRRQQEISDALDLTKNQASGQLAADLPTDKPVTETDGDALKEEFEGGWY